MVPYGNAGRRVLALVSGMRPGKRLTRGLLVLQAFIDESIELDAKDGGGRLFVMAGFVTTVENWIAFSDEWSELLELGPPHWRRIDEFHMVDMAKSQLGLEQSELFYRVIEKHLDVAVACAVRLDDLKREYEKINWPAWIENSRILINEYFAGFNTIVQVLATHAAEIGITEPVDVVFDESMSAAKCLQGWRMLKSPYGHPGIRGKLGETPIFRSSMTTMPLQAADLLAFWLRRSMLEVPIDAPEFKLKMPWDQTSKPKKSMCLFKTPEMIRKDFHNTILALSLLRAGVRPEQVSAIVSPGYGRR